MTMEQYRIIKVRKDGSIVGYLSKSKRRWLPDASKHPHLILTDQKDVDSMLGLFHSKYGWQHSHSYTYKSQLLNP